MAGGITPVYQPLEKSSKGLSITLLFIYAVCPWKLKWLTNASKSTAFFKWIINTWGAGKQN